MKQIPYTAKQIQAVSLATGVSPYKLKKWYTTGAIAEITTHEVEQELKKHIKSDTLLDRETAEFYVGGSSRLDAAIACGAVLPTIDGRFYSDDLVDLTPHKFAVLPAIDGYVATRPTKNEPIKWFPNTVERKAAFMAAYGNRLKQCEWWQQDGKVFTVPDGCFSGSKVRSIQKTWRVDLKANAPLYAPDVVADTLGQVVRVRVQGFSTYRETIVNLAIMDDWCVWTYAHGKYSRIDSWHDALYRAMIGVGLTIPRHKTCEDELQFLTAWLDKAAYTQ